MPEARPSQRAAYREATRRNILAAARNLFMTVGVDAVSMDDVAIAAEVGRATVYLHFAGKQPLLEALLLEDWERQAKLFTQLGQGKTIDCNAIAAWLRRVVEGMRRASASFALHRVALGQNEAVAGLHRAHRLRLADILRTRLLGMEADDAILRIRVESLMIVAEIEYLAAAAVTEWQPGEIEAAITVMTERLDAFRSRRG